MNRATEIQPPTGSPEEYGEYGEYGNLVKNRTRTTADLVNEAGHLKNQVRFLVSGVAKLQQSSESTHMKSLTRLHSERSNQRNKESLLELLNELRGLGFSWSNIARVSGVSVPAVRKWRRGGSATAHNRMRVAKIAALCDIARELYSFPDVAAWLETPLDHQASLDYEAPITPIDLIAAQRFDLVLLLTSDYGGNPEPVLDQFDPEWRQRYASNVEVFTAPDRLPGIRIAEGQN